MVKKFLSFTLLLLLCALSASAAANLPVMLAAAQDSGGTVWALPGNSNGNDHTTDGKAYCWQAGAWVEQTIPGAAGFCQRAMTRGDDGSVYIFWQNTNWQNGTQRPSQCLVTVHRGIGSRILARFPNPFAQDTPFPSQRSLWVGAGGDIWLFGDQSLLWHRAPDGTVGTFPLKPDQIFGGQFVQGFPNHPLGSSTDSLGRRWFWQSAVEFWTLGLLRGVLIWDGKTMAYHATLPGLPDRPFSIVAPLNSHFLWAAQSKDGYPWVGKLHGGLYRIDTKTLTAEPVAPPSKEAFQSIARIFRIRGDWCVLEGAYGPYNVLWRQQGALWRREPQALIDSEDGYGDMMPQATLEVPLGTWLAVNGAGLYWLPKNSKPAVRVDWRRGLAIGKVSSLFRLPGGKVMAFGNGFAVFPPYPHPLYPARLGVRVGEQAVPRNLTDLVSDLRHHLWGLEHLGDSRQVLDEWDGRHWSHHPLPKSVPVNSQLYVADVLGRIWLTTSIWNPPAQPQPVEGRAVYDPAHDTWTQYKTVPEALQAAATLPGMAFVPRHNYAQLPVFSGDGRVTYVDNSIAYLYDGIAWRHWGTHDILPSYPYGNAPERPRFNQNGHLEVTLDPNAWEWTLKSGWQSQGPVTPTSAPPLPPGGPTHFLGYPTTDNRGAQWVEWGGDIYLIWHGLWAKQPVLSGLGSPFWDGRGLSDVLQDPNGRYFFLTAPGGYYEYVAWSPPAVSLPPAPRIQIMPLGIDAVRLRFAAPIRGPHWFQWRLNGGAWSAAQTVDAVVLKALLPGTYRVEVQAINTLLQASPAPSAAVFVIQSASAAQIARWVQTLLSGTDNAREAAVAGLVKQPADALPALNAARPGASEPARWWLDAAIQQIEEKTSGTK